MIRSLLALILCTCALALQLTGLQSCATPTAPTGGPRDSLGPILIAEETTPNFQTNFRPEEIVLTFDEWVELDRQQPILISPPLDLGPDNQPTLRRRSLVIPLEGVELRDSVTYVVNVGAAIKDLNEGNPTENLRFVFATGPVLDTSTVSGNIVTDYSGEPIEDATFTLYGNLADSAYTTENPTYFAQTDELGNFTVYNVKPGVYRAVALQRNPGATNYFFDLAGFAPPQAAGYLDSLVVIGGGENAVGTVRLSPILKPVRVNAIDTSLNGQIRLTMNQPAAVIDASFSGNYLRRDVKDTLTLFYRSPTADTVFLTRSGTSADTVVVTDRPGAGNRPFFIQSGSGNNLLPGGQVEINFDRPLDRIDTSLVVLARDTLPRTSDYTVALDSADAGVFRLTTQLVSGSRYKLSLLPGALTDWVGNQNQDTLNRAFRVGDPEDFGTLTLNIENLLPTEKYILQLVKDDEVMVATFRYIEERFDYRAVYPGLAPGTYRVELLYDSNENRRFDSGDFLFGLQPEEVRRYEIEPLRANWEVEQTIVVDFDDPGTLEVEDN